ncbi:hypothetical protein PVAG01_05621 [Phlyctema vagabunda]|uniref:Uncharacterized protein n=1 Tax=Phlyctema vagabunda TaxID=108571 RepID=A0ABR4PKJ6_9HELO
MAVQTMVYNERRAVLAAQVQALEAQQRCIQTLSAQESHHNRVLSARIAVDRVAVHADKPAGMEEMAEIEAGKPSAIGKELSAVSKKYSAIVQELKDMEEEQAQKLSVTEKEASNAIEAHALELSNIKEAHALELQKMEDTEEEQVHTIVAIAKELSDAKKAHALELSAIRRANAQVLAALQETFVSTAQRVRETGQQNKVGIKRTRDEAFNFKAPLDTVKPADDAEMSKKPRPGTREDPKLKLEHRSPIKLEEDRCIL